MSVLNFEDLAEFEPWGGYLVPNEQRESWEKLIGRRPVYKAAAICSGGEVGFLTLLPRVRQELVLVDHSYKSLAAAMAKYLALQDLGAEAAYKLFTTNNDKAVLAKLARYRKELPNEKLQVAFGKLLQENRYGSRIKSEWSKTPLNRVKIACTKLNKVRFIHGDLSDLIEKGPFGLLYLSNALEHSGRKGAPKIAELTKAVRPGGYVLSCDAYGNRGHKGLEPVDEDKPSRTSLHGKLWWAYKLYRVPATA